MEGRTHARHPRPFGLRQPVFSSLSTRSANSKRKAEAVDSDMDLGSGWLVRVVVSEPPPTLVSISPDPLLYTPQHPSPTPPFSEPLIRLFPHHATLKESTPGFLSRNTEVPSQLNLVFHCVDHSFHTPHQSPTRTLPFPPPCIAIHIAS